MRNPILRATPAVLAFALAGCWNKELLEVPNLNNPDVARTYATPAGVESVISATFKQIWSAEFSCTGCINTQGHNLALENYSELNNFVMNIRSLIPRGAITNERGGSGTGDNYVAFRDLSKVTRSVANGLQAVQRLRDASTSTPKNALGSPAQDARARAFGYFTAGWALGGLAIAYDSAAIVLPSTPSDEVPPLSAYKDVLAAALLMLDTAIYWANHPDASVGSDGFPLPSTWINGNPLTRDNFVRLVRTQKARLRAAVARNPAERAAVDWASVIADAQNGITANFVITLEVAAGWSGNGSYDTDQMHRQGWHGLPALTFGMADTSGAYANFIATPFGSRDGNLVLIRTPDQRFPQGATRAAQQADTPLPLPGLRYIKNRPTGDDVPQAGYGSSNYDHRRFYPVRAANGNGTWVAISKVEMDMLIAEGYIRQNNFAGAAALIDASRARVGLPSIGTITSAAQKIAGGNGCVPKVPQPPGFNTVDCGTILEAMKWEKRMETAYACMYLCWFTDARGWGDLPEGTAVQWPVPYQEMDARVRPFYSMVGNQSKGTYGW